MMRDVPYAERDVFSSDEAVVRAWSNGAEDGIPVLICNGLGAPAECWPGLYDDDTTGLRVVSFFHRGTSGSGKPLDESATYLTDHASDALAVMAAYDLGPAIVVGWSVGVAVAFEVAQRAPDRVAGIVAVAGVPRGREGLRRIMASLGQAAASGAFQAARALPAPLLDLIGQVPVNPVTLNFLRYSGLVSPGSDPELIAPALIRYLEHDPAWYLRLAEQAARSDGPSGSDITCPVTFLSGRADAIVPATTVVESAAAVPGSRVELVSGSHFLPMERPELVRDAIVAMARDVGLPAASG